MSQQHIDHNTINNMKLLMEDKFQMLIERFLQDAEKYIKTIEDGITQNNIKIIVTPAHTLKSSSRQLGAIKLSDIAQNIEKLAKTGEMGNIANLTQLLKTEFVSVKEGLLKVV